MKRKRQSPPPKATSREVGEKERRQEAVGKKIEENCPFEGKIKKNWKKLASKAREKSRRRREIEKKITEPITFKVMPYIGIWEAGWP
jgi:hypothetical protein